MLFRTHLVFAISVYFLIRAFSPLGEGVVFFIFLLLGNLFVDIDSKKSKIGHWIIFRPLQLFFKHRGPIHSIFLAVLISLIIGGLHIVAGIGFFFGYMSHILIDCLTLSGVKLLWPFSDWKFKGWIRSGGTIEDIIFVLLLLGNIFVVGKWVFHYLF